MFAIAIEYLMGWAMACADGARKERAEWPPHPDRLFMAMAAAWFETGCDSDQGEALRWLEALDPPALHASEHQQRSAVTHYVPINDGMQLPEQRVRKGRSFPVAVPEHPVVHFIWHADMHDRHRHALTALCCNVTSVGHSASLVRASIDDGPPPANWMPQNGAGAIRLRVAVTGRLANLEQRLDKQNVLAHAAMEAALKQAKGVAKQRLQLELNKRFPSAPVSLRPEPGSWQPYVRPRTLLAGAEVSATSVFDDRLLVLALAGRRLGLQSTLQLTAALRGAVLAGCAPPLPEWLTGHAADGAPSREPHLALLPLAFTNAAHADGRLLGVALALPRGVPPADAARVLGPFLRGDDGAPRDIQLFNGRCLECTAVLESRDRPPVTLQEKTWVGPSRRWATVTPIALDRHQHGSDGWARAVAVVAEACVRIGLPRPVDVLLHPNALLEGAPPGRDFAPIVRKRDGGALAHTHAVLRFGCSVIGPVVLGAGRFRGYGLCRPLPDQGDGDV